MVDLRGMVRERWGTLRTGAALFHPHLIRMRWRGDDVFRRYARPVFERYIQSLSPLVRIINYSEMLSLLGIESTDVRFDLPLLDGYVGLSDWERVTIATLARHYSAQPSFEIGTAAGSTAVLLARNTTETVHTLDLPSDDQAERGTLTRLPTDDRVIDGRTRASMLRAWPQPRVRELLGDSATFEFQPYHDRIGLFFIDGAHSYEYVRSDTCNASLCCTQRGIMVWHDFGSSRDVSRWLN
ncbi:MAG: class I SAM-dependent methyltransferase, partial [Planctomycetota bacterium]